MFVYTVKDIFQAIILGLVVLAVVATLRRLASMRMMGAERKPTMPINLPQPELNRDTFDAICNRMSLSDAERIAEAFPALFVTAFEFGDAPATPEPTKPALAKTKAPKATPSAPKADRTMLLASVESVMATHPKKTAPEYTEMLASIAGDDPRFGAKVRRACEALVTAGKAVFEGEHKNRRYWPTPRGNAQELDSDLEQGE